MKTNRDKIIIEFNKKMDKLSKIKNNFIFLNEYNKMATWIADLYDDGFKSGFNEALKMDIKKLSVE